MTTIGTTVYDKGDLAEVKLNLTDLDGAPTNAGSVVLRIRHPDGAIEEHTLDADGFINHSAIGEYTARINLDEIGRWNYRWESDEPQSAEENSLTVRVGGFEAPLATSTLSEVDWRPTVEQVAILIRARTKTRQGREIGTFNNDTRPNEAQTLRIVEAAIADVQDALGGDEPCSPALVSSVQQATALRAAMKIELSFYPEQVGTSSPYDKLKAEYDEKLRSVSAAITRECGEDDGDVPGAGGPSYRFDKPVEDIGFNTVW